MVRLSAPPPLKQSKRAHPNATKMINGADTGASRSDVHIFGALRRILVEDEKMITERKALPKLPARITVFDIFQQVIRSFSFLISSDWLRNEST